MKALIIVAVFLYSLASLENDLAPGGDAPHERERSLEMVAPSVEELAETVRALKREIDQLRKRVAELEGRNAAMSLQQLPDFAIEERLAIDPGFQMLQNQLSFIEQQLMSRAAVKDGRSDRELARLENEREQILARLNERRRELSRGRPADSNLPRGSIKKYFNGAPYYITPLTAGG